MALNPQTFSALLSGSISFSPLSARCILSTSNAGNYVSEITHIMEVSNQFYPVITRSTAAFSGSLGIALSANKTIFPNVTSTFPTYYTYIYTYADTGNPATSRVINVSDAFYGLVAHGLTNYTYPSDQIMYLQDYSANHTLYRSFREKLMNGTLGNLQTSNLKIALVDSTYTFDIQAHTFYSSILASVVSSKGIPNPYILNGALKCSDYIEFPALTGGTVTQIVTYIDSGNPATSVLIGTQNSGISNVPFTPNGSNVSFRFNSDIIFDLIG